jgi:RNA polymerase sigma-70 factor (ECF subfamily)
MPIVTKRRDNAEWIHALTGGPEQEAALADLRARLLRAARFTLRRARHRLGHLADDDLDHLAEDCAQEALTAVLARLGDFRGESRFTTWVYTFAVNVALVAARREHWKRRSLDRVFDGDEALPPAGVEDGRATDPQRRALQAEALAAVREGLEQRLTPKQRQLVRLLIFEQVPLDEVARQWGSTRNALYKLLHDARRNLKAHLVARGLSVKEILDLFAGGS